MAARKPGIKAPYGAQSRYEAFAAPKLDVVDVDQPLCLFDCLGIVGAKQRLESGKVVVTADNVGSILGHPKSPRPINITLVAIKTSPTLIIA
jgi:hypothetical protein